MASLIDIIGKRLLISKSRRSVRGSMIFLFTSALLVMSFALVVSAVVILLALNGIYLPMSLSLPFVSF